MISGKMDRYIEIQTPTESTSSDTNAVSVSGYTTYKNCWAARVHNQSFERFEGDQLVLVDSFEYAIRYIDAPAITSKMVILDDSIYYNILGRKLLGREAGWLITTATRDND